MQYAWYSQIQLSKIMKVDWKFITVASGELFAPHIDGVQSIHELCVRSWAIQMLGLMETIGPMALEAQTNQFGWKMFTVVEMKNHWLIAITPGGGAAGTAAIAMMWGFLV